MTLAEQADAATTRDALAAAARLMGLCGMSEAATAALTCDNKSAAPERWNSRRPLTHSSDSTREGLGMNPTAYASPCINFTGTEKRYQDAAVDALIDIGREVGVWSWITPRCGNVLCVEPDHLTVQSPVRLAYPHRVCIYCGRSGSQRDHLLPRRWSGDARRRYVVTVPACGTCNNMLNDTLTWSITERRALCHARLRRKYAKVLRAPDRTPEEIDEFGPNLRAFILDQADKKVEVLQMLAWPTDPAYDERALQHSGIEDPYSIGLILPDDADLDEWVRNSA